MNKLLLAEAISVMSVNSYAENAKFNDETGIVHISIIELQSGPAYSDVEFRAREDGLFELIALSEYVDVPSFRLSDSGTQAKENSQYTISNVGGIHRTSIEGRKLTLIITGISGDSAERYTYWNGNG